RFRRSLNSAMDVKNVVVLFARSASCSGDDYEPCSGVDCDSGLLPRNWRLWRDGVESLTRHTLSRTVCQHSVLLNKQSGRGSCLFSHSFNCTTFWSKSQAQNEQDVKSILNTKIRKNYNGPFLEVSSVIPSVRLLGAGKSE